MDVVILNAVGEWPQKERYIEESASLESGLNEIPLCLMLPVGDVDRMLQVEEDGSDNVGENNARPYFNCRDAKQRQYPCVNHHRHDLLQEGQAKHSVSLASHVEDTDEPNEWHTQKEKDNRLSEYPSQYLFDSLHLIVLLFGEKNSLRKVKTVKVSEVLMMMIVSVSPGIEWEMSVDADEFAHPYIGGNGREEGEVCRIVELNKKPHVVQCENGPSQYSKADVNKCDCKGHIGKRYTKGYCRFHIVWLSV